jgi:kumamolisin
MSSIPQGYRRLQGSERRPSPSAKALDIANPNESFAVTIVLRRRLNGAPLPDHDFFLNTPPSQRQRMSSSEFAVLYGASNEDIDKVIKFVTAHHLTVVDAHAARRTVIVSGTVQRMESFFATRLGRFEHQIVHGATDQPTKERYRGLDGFIHIPEDLEGIIVGVFGLDNRTVTKRNRSNDDDPPNTTPLTVPQVTSLYDFPDQSASGQTIAIFSESGYKAEDITTYFTDLGLDVPTVQDVDIDGATNTPDTHRETTMDICISASAAPGASVAVYFTPGREKGWVDLIGRVVHPNSDDPVCSVISSSYYSYNGDDKASSDFIQAVSSAFRDAALQGVTVCVASGDRGSYSKIEDGNAHVQYPASDPWVLTVGGTTIGNIDDLSYDEYVWNHGKGATGGGVSAYFPLPSYQSSATVPVSVNDQSKGRGVPDVAANSSPHSGYDIPLDGVYEVVGGTSAAAPLWAGLIARINAAMGENIGYVNPALYALGSSVFNNIDGSEGPKNNKVEDHSAPGYPAKSGWDACTGWGSPKGSALLDGLAQIFAKRCTIVLQNQIIQSNSTTFSVQVDGFRPADFGIHHGPVIMSSIGPPITLPIVSRVHPDISLYPCTWIEVETGSISCELEELDVQDTTLPPTPQRFTWVYSLTYTTTTTNLQVDPIMIQISATVTSLEGESVSSQTCVLLLCEPI